MLTDQLVSKQGPLGHVWLAANYEKKLTKQQLLNTSIIKSSEYITQHPISYSQLSQPEDSITLRLSGQLLLGIVRIYSRKTKYLLEDVNDILLKLKSSFKHAGVKLTSDNVVNLNPQDTIIANLKSITLQDQVTRFDLLYQDDLNLDEPTVTGGLFSQQPTQDSFSFDQSVEYPRYGEPMTPGDDDIELDFDLNDDSIEVGRDRQQPEQEDISIIQGLDKDDEIANFDFDGGDDEQVDVGEDAVTLGEVAITPGEDAITTSHPETIDSPQEAITPPPIRRRNVITEDGELISTKRKLKVDSVQDLEGISIQTLKENQLQILNGQTDRYITLNLTDPEKLQLIYELSEPIAKRRKIWDADSHLQQRCLELSREEEELEEQHNLQFENDFENDFNNDFDDNFDFNLSLPDFEEDIEENVEEFEEDETDSKAKSTIQVAGQLREIFTDNSSTTFAKLLEKDMNIGQVDSEMFPLGVNRTTKSVNKRKEATKCFFELLVLATNDCLELKQDSHQTEIVGEIGIGSRDKLFSQFL
jgi:cohesin complex subunit SCC1